jgi:hypothetical protein
LLRGSLEATLAPTLCESMLAERFYALSNAEAIEKGIKAKQPQA